MTSELDLDKIRSSAEPGAMFGAIIIRDLVDRLVQAEQDRVKLMNRLDAMRRQRDGYRNQLRKTEQQIQKVRVELGYIPEDFSARIRRALDGDTRRLADQGLGDNLARTTKNGDSNA